MTRRRTAVGPRGVPALLLLVLLGVGATPAGTGASPRIVVAVGEASPDRVGPADVDQTGPSDTGPTGESDVPTPADTERESDDGGAIGLASRWWWLGAVLGLAAGWLLGRGSRRRAIPTAPDPRASAAPAGAPAPDPPPVRASPGTPQPDAGLVEDLILGHDLARDEAIAGHLEQVLSRLGVTPVRADPGTAFDSTIHRAVGTEHVATSTPGPVIVRVERPGWRTGTALLRQPEVIVSPPTTRPGG